MLVNQIGAFNSPVWFNCGLLPRVRHRGLGRQLRGGPGVRPRRDDAATRYSRPQVSACFIQSVGDDLMSIFELVKNEARVFKFGSGTGTNFSKLRGKMENLSGGGTSSGPDELPRSARSRRRRHQVGRHHAARGQDGRARHGPPRDRGFRPLEEPRGEEGRGAGRRRLLRRTSTARPTPPSPARTPTTPCACPTASWRRSAVERRLETPRCARPARSTRRCRRASCGATSPRPRGAAPIPASSTTTRSRSGTPARRPIASTRPTPARSSSSSTTRRAISRRSTS